MSDLLKPIDARTKLAGYNKLGTLTAQMGMLITAVTASKDGCGMMMKDVEKILADAPEMPMMFPSTRCPRRRVATTALAALGPDPHPLRNIRWTVTN